MSSGITLPPHLSILVQNTASVFPNQSLFTKKSNTAGATGIPSGTNQARSHSATHSQSICYSFYKLLMTENTFQLQLKAHKIQSLGKPQTEGNRAFFANISCHISSEYIKKGFYFLLFLSTAPTILFMNAFFFC